MMQEAKFFKTTIKTIILKMQTKYFHDMKTNYDENNQHFNDCAANA